MHTNSPYTWVRWGPQCTALIRKVYKTFSIIPDTKRASHVITWAIYKNMSAGGPTNAAAQVVSEIL